MARETFEQAFDRISFERGGAIDEAVRAAAALASGTRCCPHCDSYTLEPGLFRCQECGKRETEPRCSRCGDTGYYETVDSRARYSPYVEVRCACVRRAA